MTAKERARGEFTCRRCEHLKIQLQMSNLHETWKLTNLLHELLNPTWQCFWVCFVQNLSQLLLLLKTRAFVSVEAALPTCRCGSVGHLGGRRGFKKL